MSEQLLTERLHQAAKVASSGQREVAAQLCREVLASQPQNVTALLWLGYTSPNQVEAEDAIGKAYDLAPQNPDVLKAVDWYNTHFVDPSTAPPPNTKTAPVDRPPADRMLQPAGDPVKDHPNFIMSQTGSMVIGSLVLMGTCLLIIIAYSGLLFRDDVFTPFGLRREIYAVGAALVFLAALGFFIFSVMDVLTPPINTTGFISNRKRIRRDVKSRYGNSGTEYHFEADFMPDNPEEVGKTVISLKLTEEQFAASGTTNRGRVICSKKLGTVRVYQPLRSVH